LVERRHAVSHPGFYRILGQNHAPFTKAVFYCVVPTPRFLATAFVNMSPKVFTICCIEARIGG
jgi:hypothetical protein